MLASQNIYVEFAKIASGYCLQAFESTLVHQKYASAVGH